VISDVVRQKAQKYIFLAGVLGTLIVTPWFNMEPINVPKLLVIAIFGFAAFGVLVPYVKVLFSREFRLYLFLGSLFVVQMLVSFFSSDVPWSQQLFGTFGRNTGFVAYLSLVLLFVAGVATSTYNSTAKLMYGLLGVGLFNAAYGAIQWAGMDPIRWENPYNSILGTLGNPNFVSSFLGMSAIVAFALFFDRGRSIQVRAACLIYAAIGLFLAYESDSIQGVLVAAIGFVIVFFAFLKKIYLKIGFALVSLVGVVFAVLGTLQRGPFSSLLYQDSVTYRGDYWRAGFEMTKNYPFTGVGLDSYGDYYRASRTIEATLRRGPDVTTNSAHNVFFDISSTGGLPLLAIYLVMIVLVLRSAYRLMRGFEYRWAAVAAIGAWAAYIVQSIISINQLGLAVWGWILAGVIIGMDINRDVVDTRSLKKGVKGRVDIPASSYLTAVALGIVGLLVSVMPIVKDYSVKEALESGDKVRIQNTVLSSPVNNYYLIYTARALIENKLSQDAYQLILRAVENNPRDFNAWSTLSSMQETDEAMRAKALMMMRELDPNNPNIPA
jgi:O-antigen ligase